MKEKLFNNPWFYFALSLIHQILLFLPGPFPQTFPDSGSYVGWNPQRTPVYPFLLELFGSHMFTAVVQTLFFAIAAALFHQVCKIIFSKVLSGKWQNYFVWGSSLYFATNFELVQFSPTILTESFGISIFLIYFFCLVKSFENPNGAKKYLLPATFFFPTFLFLTRPSFILVPAAILFFFALKFFSTKNKGALKITLAGMLVYIGSIIGYALWNAPRLGHVGISDIAQHQIFANYMAQGFLQEVAQQGEASENLKAFALAQKMLTPETKDSQYSLFEIWQKLHPERNLYQELQIVNKELLNKKPMGYIYASLRNLSSLIDGRASFNYYLLEERDLPSKIYFKLQFIVDNIFCLLWFVALFYFLKNLRHRDLFSIENFIFYVVAVQFLTIAFLGYSELRRQSIGVASLQMLFVFVMWAQMLKQKLRA